MDDIKNLLEKDNKKDQNLKPYELYKHNIKPSSNMPTNIGLTSFDINNQNKILNKENQTNEIKVPWLFIIFILLITPIFIFMPNIKRFFNNMNKKTIIRNDKKIVTEDEIKKNNKKAIEDGVVINKSDLENYLKTNSLYIKSIKAIISSNENNINVIYLDNDLPNNFKIAYSNNEITLMAPKNDNTKLNHVNHLAAELLEFIGNKHNINKDRLNNAFSKIDDYQINDGFYKHKNNDTITYIIKTNVKFNIK